MKKVLKPQHSKELMILQLCKISTSTESKCPYSTKWSSSTRSTASTHTTYATIKLVPFKPEYSGKPDKDAEAHLLRTNDWMDTHRFQDHIKVQRFCLTLTGNLGYGKNH